VRPAFYFIVLAPVIACAFVGCDDEDAPLEVMVLADGQADPHSIAIDSTYVYWLGSRFGRFGTVSSVRKDGTDLTVLASTDALHAAIALDEANVYWTKMRATTGDGAAVLAVPKQGGEPVTLATDQLFRVAGIAVDDSHAYWLAGQDVLSVPKAGGAATVLASSAWQGSTVAVDESLVYAVNGCACAMLEGQLIAAPKEGGGAQELEAVYGWFPATLAVGASHVFWLAQPDRLMRTSKDGNTSEVILESDTSFRDAIALDATDAYVVDRAGIVRVPKAGGSAERVVTEDNAINSLAVDETKLYWIDASEGRIMVADKPERL
jgi:hypothetical protein